MFCTYIISWILRGDFKKWQLIYEHSIRPFFGQMMGNLIRLFFWRNFSSIHDLISHCKLTKLQVHDPHTPLSLLTTDCGPHISYFLSWRCSFACSPAKEKNQAFELVLVKCELFELTQLCFLFLFGSVCCLLATFLNTATSCLLVALAIVCNWELATPTLGFLRFRAYVNDYPLVNNGRVSV